MLDPDTCPSCKTKSMPTLDSNSIATARRCIECGHIEELGTSLSTQEEVIRYGISNTTFNTLHMSNPLDFFKTEIDKLETRVTLIAKIDSLKLMLAIQANITSDITAKIQELEKEKANL